jgi:hypothetical protein
MSLAVLIRRTLEILCNERGVTKGTLAARLKILSDKGELPPILSQTTDLLRLIGNIGAHGSEQSVHPLQVRAIDDFFTAIVEYLYVAPRKIADFQNAYRPSKGLTMIRCSLPGLKTVLPQLPRRLPWTATALLLQSCSPLFRSRGLLRL